MQFKIFTNLFTAVLLLSGAVLFSACSDDEETTPLTSTNSATATIGTTTFTSVKLNTTTESFFGETIINLDYINQAGDTLKLGIFEGSPDKTVTYEMKMNEVDLGFLLNYDKKDGSEYAPGDGDKGTLTITAHDKSARVIKGTFSGQLSPFDFNSTSSGINVTNGQFEAKY
ncbi:MAG: hypothetical protein ACO1OQ_00825 [Rufibacter sp.]